MDDNQSISNYHYDEHGEQKRIVCHAEACGNITMATPIEISAHANVGKIVLKCMNSHIAENHERQKKVVKFEIVQEVFAKIPIDFIVEVELDDERVDFDLHECRD